MFNRTRFDWAVNLRDKLPQYKEQLGATDEAIATTDLAADAAAGR